MRTCILVLSLMFWFWLGGCLLTGCVVAPLSADRLFGEGAGGEGPGLYFEGGGIKAKAKSDMKWEFDAEKDPASGKLKVRSVLDSNASKPLEQYPGWIGSMAPAQQMNFQWALSAEQEKTRQLQLITGMVDKLGTAIVPFLPQLFGGHTPPAGSAMSPIDMGLNSWNSLPPEVQRAILSGVGIPLPVKVIPPVEGPPDGP